ncbi:adenosylcobinamide amidohydrolase [Methylopila henanensis]|uniref:Adenosylcobinamide amidohydrolase n=1 Tax=Methylopila henanensis TaxID=873516 RepID=A0ABW4KCZ5_9HYPH
MTQRTDDALFAVTIARPWLVAAFGRPQAMLSWAMEKPGFREARRVAWLEVRNADLPQEVDAFALLKGRLADEGLGDAVAMMTSRDVRRAHVGEAAFGDVVARSLATVGLSNAARVGEAPGPGHIGTINLLTAVSTPLSQAALVEALSIAIEARTAAVMDLGWHVAGGVATGTGTDCVVIAAPAEEGEGARFAGLHTDIGAAIGAATYRAISAGGREWLAEREAG